MENIKEKLKQEDFYCRLKLSYLEIQTMENCFDLAYQATCIYAKDKSNKIIRLKEKIFKNIITKIVN